MRDVVARRVAVPLAVPTSGGRHDSALALAWRLRRRRLRPAPHV